METILISRFKYVFSGIVTLCLVATMTIVPVQALADMPSEPDPNVYYQEIAGSDRYETAAKLVLAAFADETPSGVIIATGENYPDALIAAGLAGLLDYPVLLSPTQTLSPYTKAALETLAPAEILILGGEGAISQDVEDALDALPSVTTVERIGGADRYLTAQAIYEYGTSIDTGWARGNAVIVTGTNFADAISISSYVTYKSAPVFLVGGDGTLDTFAKEHIGDYDRVFLVGGIDVISEDTEVAIEGLASPHDIEIVRFGGVDRYDTCMKVVEFVAAQGLDYPDPTDPPPSGSPKRARYIATGLNYPDALVAGIANALDWDALPLAYLADDSSAGMALLDVLGGKAEVISPVVFLGGTDAVPQSVRQAIADGIGGKPHFE